ncbi:hypothetical protein ACFUVV_00900 [Streptomyces sp. NPDC057376]|uniref:hypothetical protein n=1 Tax=Streptomyces sp. NPDC057376 TaxID=3346110 RepID=UPI0036352BEA
MTEPIRDLEAAVRELGALPMPVGPEPRTEVERLAMQVVALQTELSEALFDAACARRERDVIRERVSEPYGCAHCGVTKRSHGRRYISGAGMHGWARPSDEQVKDRMLARRAARVPVAPEPEAFREDGVYRNGTAARVQLARYAERTKTWSTATYDSGTERALHGMAVALAAEADASKARVAELEAAQQPAGGSSYPPALPWARLMDHEDLTEFLDELAASAITHAPAETALTEVEATCGRWRLIAEAQHAHNTAPGPDAEAGEPS